MKTRFGGSYASYTLAIAWPLSHVGVIVAAFMLTNSVAPIGQDPVIFVATAILPYIMFLYPTRMIAQAILMNRAFLSYQLVTPHHLVLARVFLEFFNVALVAIIFFLACYVLDTDIIPRSMETTVAAFSASIFLGVSLGFLFAIMTAILGPFFGVFVTTVVLALYISSFALLPEYLIKPTFKPYLNYNPIFVLIEWSRAAYYPYYELLDIPKDYVISLGVISLFLALISERLLRGRIIA